MLVNLGTAFTNVYLQILPCIRFLFLFKRLTRLPLKTGKLFELVMFRTARAGYCYKPTEATNVANQL